MENREGGRGGSRVRQIIRVEQNKKRKQCKTWILLTADLSRYKSTRMHFSSNLTPSSKVKFSCHSSRRIGLARWFPSPVATWLSSKLMPIMLTWIRYKDLIIKRKEKLPGKCFITNKKTKTKTYHAKVLLPVFHPTKYKCIPQWVELVTSIIHHTG